MTLLDFLRRVFFFLLIYVATFAIASAHYNWQSFETLLENGQHLEAIEQLDDHLIKSRARRDVTEWTLGLLRGARVRALENQQGSAINYLNYNQWPTEPLSQSILNLGLAKEYEAYFPQSIGQSKALSEMRVVEKVNYHYKLAYTTAKNNNLKLVNAQAYLTPGRFPITITGNLSDVIIAHWQQFLATEMYWSSQQKQQLNSLKLDDLLDLKNPSVSTIKHPLLEIKASSRRLIQEHQSLGKDEAVFEVKRFYAQLLTRHFVSDDKLSQISEFLSEHLRQLGSQHPWWTMGQFQLANLQRKFTQKKPLTEIHDLAVKASIIHPESLGAIKSRRLISELERSEYMITGAQTSGLDQASIDIEFKNLQKLYFKAWRTGTPLSAQLGDDMKQKIITRLLAREADKEWIAELPDQFDLRKQTIEHQPEIEQHGQWLIVASPNRSFGEERSALQLLSMQFSEFIASASYFNKQFEVAVYQTKNGLPANNVSVDLLTIENDTEAVLSSTKTDRQGIAVLQRRMDADHFRIKIHRGDDHSIIDVPSLLPLKDEAYWTIQQAKSLLTTDKDHYKEGDTVYWSLISRAAETTNTSKIKTNANQKAWLRMFDEDSKLILEKYYTTDDSGSASGKIILSRQNYPTLFSDESAKPDADIAKILSIEASWGGNKALSVLPKKPLLRASSNVEPSIKLSFIKELYQEGEQISIKGRSKGCQSLATDTNTIRWSLKRRTKKLDGSLHAYLEIDRGKVLAEASGQFNFQTQLSLGDDREHQLKHSFILFVHCFDKTDLKATYVKRLSIGDKKSYISVLNAQNFFVAKELIALNLLRSDSRSIGFAGESDWYIYERLPINAGKKLISKSISNSSRSSSWMLGSIKQNGTVSHNAQGKAVLLIKNLEAGAYKLRVIAKNNPTQAAFEYNFIVADTGVNKNISPSGLLLTEKVKLDGNNHTLRLLAGGGNAKQWSRLTITCNKKILARKMLSPGIHLLNFPIAKTHQGGVNFFLEWVENNQLFNREINVEVPWSSQRLSISLKKSLNNNRSVLRLGVLDNKGRVLPDSSKSKVLLYFTEHSENIADPSAVNLKSLYWQSRSSLMRLDNNGRSYPHYFSPPKRSATQISDIVELPKIRYTPSNSDLLSSNRSVFVIEALSNEPSQVSYLPDGNAAFSKMDTQLGVSHGNDGNTDRARLNERSPLTHFSESYLNAEGSLNIELPKKFRGKQVHLRAIVVTPDFKTGQSTIILR